MKRILGALLALGLLSNTSFAQTVPPFDPGSAPTLQVWNGYFAGKMDTPKPYTGPVATRGIVPSSYNPLFTSTMMRSLHVARDAISSAQLVYGAWYVIPGGAETPTTGNVTVTASIEYPAGTFYQAKFSGYTAGTIAAGATLVSDPIPVSIPRGAQFFVRTWRQNASAIIYANAPTNTSAGEGMVTNGSDLTMGGTVTANDGGANTAGPLAIIGTTTRPTVFIAGDSRAVGANDSNDIVASDQGDIARAVGPSYAYINGAIFGDTTLGAKANYSRRAALASYCSHVISNYGINDIYVGQSDVQIEASLQTFYGLFGGKPIIQTTIDPRTTSTDSWATTTNQTVTAGEATRVSVNGWVRSVPPLTIGYLETADAYETARNSGLFKVNGSANYFTNDGVHGVLASYRAVQAAIQPMVNAYVSKFSGR